MGRLSRRTGRAPRGQGRYGSPPWAETRRLRRFWFPFNTPAARVDAFVHAPASFRRRGVFIHPQELEVA
ncbi:hypothetical protein [Planomonospora venezuelensis]|uniref:Uncharacterized protein n=1 Tax=Planomonospora venezuelensis TaxID=1999 RepID=A0A841DAQ6_PLAVE|nr:hypothetical protein [Planomonospora venezuelensis]MBB5965205.1 hypothetical protein [Planomonospora venezuelensis]